jgi:hypothetical protein
LKFTYLISAFACCLRSAIANKQAKALLLLLLRSFGAEQFFDCR